MTTLIAKNITKLYNHKTIVQDINLTISSNNIIGLLGPNGAGKTTIFYMLAGIIFPTSGKITIDKNDITFLPLHTRIKYKICYLPQESSVFKKLTVINNILAILQFKKQTSNTSRLNYAEKIMKEFNIFHLKNTLAGSLSGGERRRLEIARTLILNPHIILLDEPFSGIDPISIENIKNILISLKSSKKIGIIITDHNVRETLTICDKSYIINNGRIIFYGTPSEIISNNYIKKIYLGSTFSI